MGRRGWGRWGEKGEKKWKERKEIEEGKEEKDREEGEERGTMIDAIDCWVEGWEEEVVHVGSLGAGHPFKQDCE